MTEEPVMVVVGATCHTPECSNADLTIPVWVVEGPDPYVVCGVCGNQITDVAVGPGG